MKTSLVASAILVLALVSGVAHSASPRQTQIARALNQRSTNPASRAYLVQRVTPSQIRVSASARGVVRWTVDAEKLAAPRSHALVPVLLTGTFLKLPPRLGNPAGGVRIRVTSITPERL
jgi:hypothetical protein